MSCAACMYKVMPSIAASFSRKRAMTWSALALRSIVRFQRDEYAPLVQRGRRAAGSDLGPDRGDRGILQHGVDHGLHPLAHGREGDVLRRFGNAEDHSGVLLREEALGDDSHRDSP